PIHDTRPTVTPPTGPARKRPGEAQQAAPAVDGVQGPAGPPSRRPGRQRLNQLILRGRPVGRVVGPRPGGRVGDAEGLAAVPHGPAVRLIRLTTSSSGIVPSRTSSSFVQRGPW